MRFLPWITPNLLIARSGFTSPIRFWRAIEARESVFMMIIANSHTQVLLRPLRGLPRAFLAMLHNWNLGGANRQLPIRHPKSFLGSHLCASLRFMTLHSIRFFHLASLSSCVDQHFRSPQCATDAYRPDSRHARCKHP
jgi:hypothetical protein